MQKTKEKEIVEFDFNDLLPFGMSLVVLTIGLAYGMQVQEDIQEDTCRYTNYNGDCVTCPSPQSTLNTTGGECYNAANTSDTAAYLSSGGYAFNGTIDGLKATAKVTGKLGTIVTVVIAAIIIGILFRYFMTKNT